jgi:O-antigen/teichoic acid export membrane protein
LTTNVVRTDLSDAAAPTGSESSVAAPEPSNLAARTISGVSWNVAAQAIVQATRIAVGVVIARLLSRSDFGLAAMALVFSGFVSLFTDLSLGAALVQRPTITEEDRSTVFWTTAAFGVVCTLVCLAVAEPIARFYGQPEVRWLFSALSVTFAITGLTVAHTALLNREMRYRTLQIAVLAGTIFGAAISVTFAAVGFGPWAIIGDAVAAVSVSTVIVWFTTGWTPRFTFSRESLRDVGGFGLTLFGSRVLAYANLNADNLLVGRFLGARALGAYALGYNVMFTPMLRIGIPIQQVLTPAFSRLQEDRERLGAGWLRAKRLLAALLLPAFAGMAVIAPDLVPVVFGAKWHPAIPVLQLLSLAGVAHSLVTSNWSALQALGRAGTLLRLNLFVTAVIVGSFAAGLHWGIVGVAAGFAIAKWLLLVPDNWVTGRALGVRLRDALAAGSTALVPVAAMAGLAAAARYGLEQAGIPAAARLAIVIVIGAAAYAASARVLTPGLVEEFRAVLRRRRSSPSPSSSSSST